MASVAERRNKSGEIISYRVRACLGRDESYRQIWRTKTFPRPEGLTPAKERKEIQRQADAWEAEERKAFEQGMSSQKDKISLNDFISAHWMPDHVLDGKHSANGREFFRYTSGIVTSYFGERLKLAEVSPEKIKRFLRWLRVEKGYSEATQQHVLHTLTNVLNYAVRIGYLERNPADRLTDADKPSVISKPVDFLNVDEAQAFLDALKKEPLFWRTYFNLLLFAGLRRGEALGCKWEDYDAEGKTLQVCRNITPDKQTESKKVEKSTKTGKNRVVPIADGLAELLDARKREVLNLYGDVDSNWFIFGTAEEPGKPLYPTSPGTWLRRFEKRHGLRMVGVHVLRHSAGSLSLEAGASLQEVKQLLGHSSITTTSKHYIGLTMQRQRKTVEGIEILLSKETDE